MDEPDHKFGAINDQLDALEKRIRASATTDPFLPFQCLKPQSD